MKYGRATMLVAVCAVFLVGCAPSLGEPGMPTGSAMMATSQGRDAVYVADADNGAVTRVDLLTGQATEYPVGDRPTRVAVAGNRIFVTLRGEGAIAELFETSEGVLISRVVEVGEEPYGIVVTPDGSRIYVALSTADTVVELDGASLTIIRSWHIPDQPRWLALSPNLLRLFVASAYGGSFHLIHLDKNEVEVLEIPGQEREDRETGDVFDLDTRCTGDPSVSPDGERVAIPVLLVDSDKEVPAPQNVPDGGGDQFVPPTDGGYGMVVTGSLGRFTPAVVVMKLDGKSRPKDDEPDIFILSGVSDLNVAGPDGTDIFDEEAQDRLEPVGSYLTTAVFNPAGSAIFVTMEGSKTVAAVATHPVGNGPGTFAEGSFFGDGLMTLNAAVHIGVDAGPTALVFTDVEEAFAYSFLERSVSNINYARIDAGLESRVLHDDSPVTWRADRGVSLPVSDLPEDVLEGRRLFYSSTSDHMAASGSGVSCATCHFEGRNDGLTWNLEEGLRQTPSLAGEVSLTVPVTWGSNVSTVGEEARITSQGRMGGEGIDDQQQELLAAFIDWTPRVVVPRVVNEAAAPDGAEIFFRPDVGCANCHVPPLYTNNKSYPMFGEAAVNTPPLVGIGATAPYLHDGSAETLLDVVDRAQFGEMGDTSMLDAEERRALADFLAGL